MFWKIADGLGSQYHNKWCQVACLVNAWQYVSSNSYCFNKFLIKYAC